MWLRSMSSLICNAVYVGLSMVVFAGKNAVESNDDHACTHRPRLVPRRAREHCDDNSCSLDITGSNTKLVPSFLFEIDYLNL